MFRVLLRVISRRERSRMRRRPGNSRTFRGQRKTASKPENLRMFLIHHSTLSQGNERSRIHRRLLRSHQPLKTQRVLL
jgi:hypothetical protein